MYKKLSERIRLRWLSRDIGFVAVIFIFANSMLDLYNGITEHIVPVGQSPAEHRDSPFHIDKGV
jgi:hypothetical protein